MYVNHKYSPRTKKQYNPGIVYYDEVYVPVNKKLIPNMVYEYYVSNYGNIYNKSTGYLVPQQYQVAQGHTDGYMRVDIKTTNGYVKKYVHDIVYWSFYPEKYDESLQIDHLDGKGKEGKCNNRLSNLDCCDGSENMRRSYQTSIHPDIQKVDDDIVTKICELIQDNHSVDEIVNIIGYCGISDMRRLVRAVWKREYHIKISEPFTFPEYEDRVDIRMSKDELDKAIEYMKLGKSYKEVMNLLGYTLEKDGYIYERLKNNLYYWKTKLGI